MRFTRIVLAIAVSGIAALSVAQAEQKPKFEVASIKPMKDTNRRALHGGACNGADHPVTMGPITPGLGRRIFTGATLKALLGSAYGIEHIEGGPNWIESDEFEVQTKAEDPKTTRDGLLEMLQQLLETRFQLKFHDNRQDISGYTLVVAKGGPKIKSVRDDDEQPKGMVAGLGRMVGLTTTAQIARSLSIQLRSPVVDGTGLSGWYDVKMEWAAATPTTGNTAEPSGPSLFTAIQEQLGLKLEPTKVHVQLLVVESAQRPSEN